jgi:hypothetical protein
MLAAALVASCLVSARAENAPVLLAKYDFEDIPAWIPNWGAGLGSTYKPATGWKTPFMVSLDTDNPHAGGSALRFELLEPSEKEKIVHGPAIKVEPSEGERRVRVRLFARAVGFGETGAGIRILEKDEKGASIRLLNSKNTLIAIPDSPDWVELDAEGVLHSRTASLTFMVVGYQMEAPATLWIDDVSVELEPSAP